MPKIEIPKVFSFSRRTKQQMADYINDKYPISLENQKDLINRVHDKYPILDKRDISLIIKTTFESIRELLILGKILNIRRLLFSAKLLIFANSKIKFKNTRIKIRVFTPPDMQKC